MDWKEKVLVGMKLIKEGCHESTDWTNCKDCPFDEFCDYIADKTKYEIPETLF